MSNRDERIQEIRGRERYEEGLRHLRVVSHGAREGALPSFRTRAHRLLALEQELTDDRRLRIRGLLAQGTVGSTEDALIALENEEREKE